MQIKEAMKRVESSAKFKEFRRQEPDAYLAHAFSMHVAGNEGEWQLGYFLPKREKLVVFRSVQIERLPEDEAFNKGEPIARLDMKSVKMPFEEAEAKAMATKQEAYPAEEVTKVIVILQHLDRQLYNFTLVTRTFNMINIRVDASSGEVIKQSLQSIMSLSRDH